MAEIKSGQHFQSLALRFVALVMLASLATCQQSTNIDTPTNCNISSLPATCACFQNMEETRLALDCRLASDLQSIPHPLGGDITDLIITQSSIESLPANAVQTVPNSLEYIMIDSSSSLSSIDRLAFTGLTSLKSLIISNCPLLTSLPEDFLDPLSNLEILNLEANNIANISACQFQRVLKLIKINLNTNKIVSLAPGTFANLHFLTELLLDYNLIQTIVPEAFFLLPNTTIAQLDLSLIGNPFSCDCSSLWIQWLLVDASNRPPLLNTPSCSSPQSLWDKPFDDVPRTELCSLQTPRILHSVGSVTRGQTTSLTCASFISSKRPLYYWYKDGVYQSKAIASLRYHFYYGVLTIENVTAEDAGSWLCHVTDPLLDAAGFVKSEPFQLAVSETQFCGHPLPATTSSSDEVERWIGVGLGIFFFVIISILLVYCCNKRLGDVSEARQDTVVHGRRYQAQRQQNFFQAAPGPDSQTYGLAENPEYLKYLKHSSRSGSQSSGVAIGGGGGSLSYLQSPGGGIRNPISGQRSPSGHSNSSKEFISPGTRFGMERGEFGVPRMVENPLVAMGYGEMDDATNQDAAGNNAETPVDESATALPYQGLTHGELGTARFVQNPLVAMGYGQQGGTDGTEVAMVTPNLLRSTISGNKDGDEWTGVADSTIISTPEQFKDTEDKHNVPLDVFSEVGH